MDAPSRRLSAGVVVVRETAEGPRFLLLRAYRHWDFPKGMVEPGETPLDAAKREVEEETGLAGLDFRWGEDFRETPPYARGKVARYYLARTPQAEVLAGVSKRRLADNPVQPDQFIKAADDQKHDEDADRPVASRGARSS